MKQQTVLCQQIIKLGGMFLQKLRRKYINYLCKLNRFYIGQCQYKRFLIGRGN